LNRRLTQVGNPRHFDFANVSVCLPDAKIPVESLRCSVERWDPFEQGGGAGGLPGSGLTTVSRPISRPPISPLLGQAFGDIRRHQGLSRAARLSFSQRFSEWTVAQDVFKQVSNRAEKRVEAL
jgi:hypothetical protein